jgi:hypothetical protein
VDDFEAFELEVRDMLMEVEAEVLAAELAKCDVGAPVVLVDGEEHVRVLRSEATYQTSAGKVSVPRHLYRPRSGGPTVVPLDLRAGIVAGGWTPRAAKQAVFAMAHLPIETSAEMFAMVGCMVPSKSSLDRLNAEVGATWEVDRPAHEAALRRSLVVPPQAKTVAASIDGVMVPMRDGDGAAKRAHAKEHGKQPSGPAGFQEVGCCSLSFYDTAGNRLSTIRYGRMPQPSKTDAKAWLAAELWAALAIRPDLQVVKVADGARDNWAFLDGESMPAGESVVDFFHAVEHLGTALAAAYREGSDRYRARLRTLRRVLRDDADGAGKIIRALRHLRDRHPKSKVLARELAYFRRYRTHMRYADLRDRHLPIGSGVIEAACKSLAADRMKRSGMRWTPRGGQPVLTFRALHQSDRFQAGWDRVVAAYKAHVALPDNVIPFPRGRP